MPESLVDRLRHLSLLLSSSHSVTSDLLSEAADKIDYLTDQLVVVRSLAAEYETRLLLSKISHG